MYFNIFSIIRGVSKYFLKYRDHCIDDFQSIQYYTPYVYAEKEHGVPRFSVKASSILHCRWSQRGFDNFFQRLHLILCKDHVNIHAALN